MKKCTLQAIIGRVWPTLGISRLLLCWCDLQNNLENVSKTTCIRVLPNVGYQSMTGFLSWHDFAFYLHLPLMEAFLICIVLVPSGSLEFVSGPLSCLTLIPRVLTLHWFPPLSDSLQLIKGWRMKISFEWNGNREKQWQHSWIMHICSSCQCAGQCIIFQIVAPAFSFLFAF